MLSQVKQKNAAVVAEERLVTKNGIRTVEADQQ
jgi:hypothetical protein